MLVTTIVSNRPNGQIKNKCVVQFIFQVVNVDQKP